MYARILTFNIGPGNRDAGEKLASRFGQLLRARKGARRIVLFGDDQTGEYGSFILWESREDGEEAAAELGPKLREAISGMVKTEPSAKVYEVLSVIDTEAPVSFSG